MFLRGLWWKRPRISPNLPNSQKLDKNLRRSVNPFESWWLIELCSIYLERGRISRLIHIALLRQCVLRGKIKKVKVVNLTMLHNLWPLYALLWPIRGRDFNVLNFPLKYMSLESWWQKTCASDMIRNFAKRLRREKISYIAYKLLPIKLLKL